MQTKNAKDISTGSALNAILIASILCAIGLSSYPGHLRAEPITFQFEGYVNNVSPSLEGEFAELQPFQGTYTFESTTPDIAPEVYFGVYEPLVGLEYSIGEYAGSLGSGSGQIQIVDAHDSVFTNDVYAVYDLSPVGDAVAGLSPTHFFLQLTDGTGLAINSDTLPLEPPSLADFNTAIWVLSFGNSGADVVQGFVTSFTLSPDVTLDVRPGSESNPLNLKSRGNLPVAILTTDAFDALQVDWETVEFGPGRASEVHQRSHASDVDGDGDMDLLLHFKVQDTGIECGQTEASLTGMTFGGEVVSGTDAIATANCP